MKNLMLLLVAAAALAQINAAQALPLPNDPNSPCAKPNPPQWCQVATGPIVLKPIPRIPRIPREPFPLPKPFPFPIGPECLSCPPPGVLDNVRFENPRLR